MGRIVGRDWFPVNGKPASTRPNAPSPQQKNIEQTPGDAYSVTIMQTARRVQKFKPINRRRLAARHAKGVLRVKHITLAASNTAQNNRLDVSRVQLTDDEDFPAT
ncbi:MAG: hypothetical protein ABSG59_01740 [Verrucomicrobiota bacterium]|jgi:hypothetical protein